MWLGSRAIKAIIPILLLWSSTATAQVGSAFYRSSMGCKNTIFGNMANNTSNTAYSSALPAGACSSFSEVRTCKNAVLSGTFGNATCTDGCTGTPWGAVSSGYSNTAYSSATPAATCASVSQTRTCTAGTMSGTFTITSCTNGCTGTPWGNVSTGYSNTAYSSATPAGACTSFDEIRTCTNGTLSGSFTNTSCTNGCTGTPWGNVSTGYSNTAYSSATPAGACTSFDEIRTCTNGTLSGSFTSTTCTNGCTGTPWGSVSHGYSNTAYQSSAPVGTSCVSQVRTCSSGSMNGTYTATSCNNGCASTGTSWGTGSACSGTAPNLGHGGSQAISSTTPNTTGSVTATCTNGVWSYPGASCTINHYLTGSYVASYEDSTAQTTYTISGASLGALPGANENRVIVIVFGGNLANPVGTIGTVTIRGVTATQVIDSGGDGTTGTGHRIGIFYAQVNAGTTGNIVINWNATRPDRFAMSVFRLVHNDNGTFSVYDSATDSGTNPSQALTCSTTAGYNIAGFFNRNQTSTWAGATERIDTDVATFMQYSTASGGCPSSPRTITTTVTPPSSSAWGAASFRVN